MHKRRDAISKIDKMQRFMRCFEETIRSLTQHKSLPLPLCYQRAKTYFKIEPKNVNQDTNIYLFDSPCEDLKTYYNYINNFEYLNSNHVIDRNVVEYVVSNSCTRINNFGRWILLTKIKIIDDNITNTSVVLNPPLWLLKYRYGEEEQPIKLTEIMERNNLVHNEKCRYNKDWINYIEACYSLTKDMKLNENFKPNFELMSSLSEKPKDWILENDEELADLLKDIVNTDIPGSIRNLIKSINVSTQRTSEDTEFLLSLDRRTFWESDSYGASYNGYNSIRIFLKPGKKIKQMYIIINKKNRQYMPKEVLVFGGACSEDIVEIHKLTIKPHEDGDILILENCSKIYDYLEIRIKSCQRNGTNCRVYGIKIFTQSEGDENLPSEIFIENKLHLNYPRLSNYRPTFLFRRAELLIRFIKLFDFCMDALLPSWTYDNYFQDLIKSVKKLLILSSRRITLLDKILNSIPTTPCSVAAIHIDRPLAFAYRGKLALDPKYQNTIFMQIYNNLGPSNCSFRWEKSMNDQWWECKFIGEGIIDQGGGFRDSLSDIAEEMCPNTSVDFIVPLPFFIRTPNQKEDMMNTFKDTFIPNPSCQLLAEYEFIGKLMGACLRSKETLALYLSPIFWKKLSDETITWKNDFVTVDAAVVKLLDSIEKMEKEDYQLKFHNEITWSCVLSDGTMHNLQPNGHQKFVSYEERSMYCEQVKAVRLSEFDKQIEAIKKGIISVVSKHIFYILTWSEFELKICGTAQISVEDLKMSIEYDDELTFLDNRVKFFWEAIGNFSNEERSKFVRFVTGRKRLPVKIFFCASDQPPTSFPDSSTCNCSLYFPNYTTAQIAEDKLRYAIHNCVAIDTDCSSYDD